MKKITSAMGDFTMAIMDANAVGFKAVEKKYDLVAGTTFHQQAVPAAAPSMSL